MIDDFTKQYFFLSNFYESPCTYEGLTYQSVEAAFQSAKTVRIEERTRFTLMNPSEAKRAGRRIALRQDWEQIKDTVMYECLKSKFSDPALAKRLIATGNEELREGNTWGDTYWGVCEGVGKNRLGKLLMKVRKELKEQQA